MAEWFQARDLIDASCQVIKSRKRNGSAIARHEEGYQSVCLDPSIFTLIQKCEGTE